MLVVVPRVLGEDLPEVPFAVDQQVVEALALKRSHLSFRKRIAQHRQLHPIRTIGTGASA